MTTPRVAAQEEQERIQYGFNAGTPRVSNAWKTWHEEEVRRIARSHTSVLSEEEIASARRLRLVEDNAAASQQHAQDATISLSTRLGPG